MIRRSVTDLVEDKLGSGKAIMLIGPWQVGKTTLILNQLKGNDYAFFDGDDPAVRTELNT